MKPLTRIHKIIVSNPLYEAKLTNTPNTGCRNQKVEDRIFKIDIRKIKKMLKKLYEH